jgi:hypothetical protein
LVLLGVSPPLTNLKSGMLTQPFCPAERAV